MALGLEMSSEGPHLTPGEVEAHTKQKRVVANHKVHNLNTEQIGYKLAMLVYQCVLGLAPAYLADAL